MCNLVARLMAILSILLIFSCNSNHDHANWSYDGSTGPSHWSELSSDFIACVEGHRQSPIDIHAKNCKELRSASNLELHYVPSVFDIVNNGHTEQVNCLTEDEMVFENNTYRLNQFHFHTPSEHTIDGKYFPMEIHFVHLNEQNELAVVGLFVDEGAHNAAFDPVFEHLPTHIGEHDIVPIPLNPIQFFPKNMDNFRYEGSLTTPPCSENVHWLVLEEHISMSKSQLSKFQKLFPHNNRPIQPLYERGVAVVH